MGTLWSVPFGARALAFTAGTSALDPSVLDIASGAEIITYASNIMHRVEAAGIVVQTAQSIQQAAPRAVYRSAFCVTPFHLLTAA